jgi:hypothetical protein
MPPPEKVIKEFPRQGDLQLFRLDSLHEFQCGRCQVDAWETIFRQPGKPVGWLTMKGGIK